MPTSPAAETEPTQADYDLALKLVGSHRPQLVPLDMWQDRIKTFARYIRAHVAQALAEHPDAKRLDKIERNFNRVQNDVISVWWGLDSMFPRALRVALDAWEEKTGLTDLAAIAATSKGEKSSTNSP